ncbi:MAG: hypothetical protein JWP81_493 [Ferruginibacter sp.]|nr:hypothetical protein [Ferruginibacter sp.]
MRFLVSILLAASLYHVGFAQNPQQQINEHELCGTQEWLETQFRAYPALRLQYEQMEQKMGHAVAGKLAKARAASSNASPLNLIMASATVVTIPIVFHIVHSSPSSITDAQIYALLDTLNKDFGGNNGDSTKIPAAFKPLFGKGNIRFTLAQRTPAGINTNGIIRYASSTISTGSGYTSDPIKSTASGGADAWNPNQYFNVWIGTFSVSGLLGYAAFPITSGENPAGLLSQQGVVIEKGSIPRGATTDYNNGRVLTHEAGHYFWLRHIWGDAACGNDFPGTAGIDDTPPASGPSSGCGIGVVPTGCSGTNPEGRMYRNYMDYSNSICMAMFSVGQTIRMSIALDSFRASLKSSRGGEPLTCPSFNINVTSTGTSVAVSVTGGQSPYAYSLDSINYQLSNQFTGLIAGNSYTMYVRDSFFCKGKVNFTANGINMPPLSASSFCVNQAVPISFTTNGAFNTGNIFTVQLSDTAGRFNSPVNIGTLTGITSGTINAIISNTALAGQKYRIRIVSSSPSVTSADNGADLEISNSSVVPSVSIAISAGTNPGCIGSSTSFTATAINGGTTPVFQWKRNGTNVSTGKVYTTIVLQNNDTITCSLLSNSTCAATDTATSNAITMLLSSTLVTAITISADKMDTICSGMPVVFTAVTVNGGTSPIYEWRKNSIPTGVTTATYTTTSLKTNDSITCYLISSLPCASPFTAFSNKITFVVNTTITPAVVITSNVGTSPCSGTVVTFTATPSNGGVSPSFQWKKNGGNVGTNSMVYVSGNLVSGDSIWCVMTRTTPAVCVSAYSVSSNILRMIIQNCSTQLLNGNAFLKESYVEVAVGPCGNFASTVVAPPGFHPRGTGSASSAGQLGFVADTSKKGWLNYIGDYFLPGTPEEGFGLTINGTNYNNNLICNLSEIAGSIISVQSGSLEKSATWQGTAGGLIINAKTYIPSGALFFVTKVTITNTSGAPVNNIYYMRNVDPDQGYSTPGSTATSSTYNSVVYQNPNACNRSLVSATTRLDGSDYLGLGSADPRARVSMGGFTNRGAQVIWNGIGLTQAGKNNFGDSAISIAFKLGTLNINESTSFSFAHILNTSSLEQALAATSVGLSINGITADIGKVNDVCMGAAVPINLGNTGNYTSWNWAPVTGLDTSGGTIVRATVTSPISYTATGTGSCGTISITIALNPVTASSVGNAGAISGPLTPSQGAGNVTYSIAPVANATRYIWKLPAGMVINYGADSNVISVRIPAFAFCDSISVTPVNACSGGLRRVITICVSSVYAILPGAVAGVCKVAKNAYLPYTGTTGSPTVYTIIWDSAAIAAGLVNVINAPLPPAQIILEKPSDVPIANYSGKIAAGNGILNSAFYNFILPVVNAPILVPLITIAANTSTNICRGTPVTFTATPVNGGAIPIFQWCKNGITVSAGSATFIYDSLANGDSITCTLISTASCVSPASVTSTAIQFSVSSTAVSSVSISSSTGSNACVGSSVTFIATALNVGASAVFEWSKNGKVVDTGNFYITSSLVQNDSIMCSLRSDNPCFVTVTAKSNTIIMTMSTVTAPSVSAPVTINCGQVALLTAKPTTAGNIINWYTTVTGSTPIAKGDSVYVSPGTTTVYYAEGGSANSGTGKIVKSISTTGGVVIDHDAITGDDHAGIVLSSNYVYYTGDYYTGRFSKNLSDGTSFPLRDGFFSNLANGDLWQLGTSTSGGASLSYGSITRLYRLSESLVPTGSFLTLSGVVNMGSQTFMAPGEGFLLIYTGGIFYNINLIDGTVTKLNGPGSFYFSNSEGWASYGWAEFDGTNYFICHVANSYTISKRNVLTGTTTVLQSFSYLGDMAAIVFDPQANRMYFHNEGSSQFGGISETLGYTPVTSTETIPLCASTRVPVAVSVNTPAIIPSVSIVANFSGIICAGTTITFTANAVNGGVSPLYQWKRNGINVGIGVTYSSNALVNNDIINCVLTSSLFCVVASQATSNNIVLTINTPSVYPAINISSTTSGSVCAGNNIVFTATALNAGSTPMYQWKKNGLNVGTNSAIYNDNGFATGSITCVMSTNIPCAVTLTSNAISIFSTTPVQPSVSIASNSVNSICAGTTVTFTATAINGGGSPLFQWKKNGINAGTGVIYTVNNLLNADTITCALSSSIFCVTQTTVISNAIGFIVNPMPAANPVANRTVCPGTTSPAISFSGTAIQYRWTNNNPAIGLAATGTGSIPAFVAVNTDTLAATAAISVTPVSAGIGYAYIANTNNNTVSVVSLTGNKVVAVIPVGSSPWAVAAAPNGSVVYVSNIGNPASVSVINTSTNQVTYTIPLNGISYNICVSADGSRLYTADYNSGVISVYNTAYNGLINYFYTGSGLFSLAISPDGAKLYASTLNYLYVINASGSIVATIPTSGSSVGLIASADGNRVYASNANNNTVSVLSTSSNTVTASIAVGNSPYGITLSPDGKNLYVANNGSNTISVINTATNEVTATVATGSAPSGLSVSVDGTLVYVTSQSDNSITIMNAVNNTVTSTVTGFSGPVSWGNFIISKSGCAGPPVTFTIKVGPPDINTWTGNVSTDWHTAANWLCQAIPKPADKVLIAVSPNNFYPVIISGDHISVKSIQLLRGTTVTVQTGASLILSPNLSGAISAPILLE